jgi:hypothetical protein
MKDTAPIGNDRSDIPVSKTTVVSESIYMHILIPCLHIDLEDRIHFDVSMVDAADMI